METHDRLAEHAAPYALGALSPAERAEFEAHLATCATCAAEVRAYGPVAVGLAQLAPPAEPSPDVRRRVLEAARAAPRANVVVITKNRPAAQRRTLAPWLAAAAALALAVGLGAYAYQMRRSAAQAEMTTSVLEAPDLVQLRLQGQAPAPNASARAFVSRSRGVVLTAANVPALPAGRTYQVWVLTAQTRPISVGLAKPDPAGRIAITLPTDPSMPPPTGVAVTIEPEGGVPVATGPAYLVGTTN